MKHLEKILYPVIVAVIAIGAQQFTEKIFAVPDYQINAKIKAPLGRVDMWLESQTGEKIYIPDAPGPNPIEVHLINTGKKPIKNLEFIMEFMGTGDLSLSDEWYSVKPIKGFGSISFSKPRNTERRVIFDLFNPGDEWMYFATGWRPVTVITYAKFPGLSFYQEYNPVGKHDNFIRLFVLIFLSLCIVFGMILVVFIQKIIIKQYGIRNILRKGIINAYWNDRTTRERLLFYYGFSLAILSSIILVKLISDT
jgi:hypothetical protein